MLYFIKGMHVRHFGFPRIRDTADGKSNQKPYKWKKTNFVTDLPKHSPACRYLVAHTSNQSDKFRMHVVFLPQEYNLKYKLTEELKRMKVKNQKLLDEDVNPDPRFERIICCHILEMDEGSTKYQFENSDCEDDD